MTFPRFTLRWVDNKGNHRSYTTKKKGSVAYKISELKAKSAKFIIRYSKGDFLNESITYHLPEEHKNLVRDYKTFSSDAEIKSCLKSL